MTDETEAPKEPTAREYRCVWYPTLRQLGTELRRAAGNVQPPVHTFDIPARLMRGLYSVAVVTDDRMLHRCVVSYGSVAGIAGEVKMLDNLLRWAELERTEGRIELGANTGELLRYFLPNVDEVTDPRAAEARRRRARGEWLAASRRIGPPWEVWCIAGGDGIRVGSLSSSGVHCLLRLGADGRRELDEAAARLDRAPIRELPADTELFRDVMGDWLEGRATPTPRGRRGGNGGERCSSG